MQIRLVSAIIIITLLAIFLINAKTVSTGVEPIDYMINVAYHADMTHIALNLVSFYNLSFIEDAIGRQSFIFAIIFIWVVSSLLLNLFHNVLPSRKIRTIGFSGVIFGLIVVYYFLLGDQPEITTTRLIISLIPQLFIPGISFEGHICGLIAGFIYIKLFPAQLLSSPHSILSQQDDY